MTWTARELRAYVTRVFGEDLTRRPQFIEGWDAFIMGECESSNPYDRQNWCSNYEHRQWFAGYDTASKNWHDLDEEEFAEWVATAAAEYLALALPIDFG